MHVELSEAAIQWLQTGDRGVSSETIFGHLTGIPIASSRWHWRHPVDPSDFWRCRQLLEAVPEFRERLPEMAQVSPVWAALVVAWEELCALMDAEAHEWPHGRCGAPKTYARMKALGC